MERPFFSLLAMFPDNRPTNCETNRSGPWPDGATQSNRDISSLLRNNKAGRETKSAALDANATNESTRPEFPFDDYRRRLLGREIRRGTTPARPRMRRCRDPNRRFGRKTSKANSSEVGARWPRWNLAEE